MSAKLVAFLTTGWLAILVHAHHLLDLCMFGGHHTGHKRLKISNTKECICAFVPV